MGGHQHVMTDNSTDDQPFNQLTGIRTFLSFSAVLISAMTITFNAVLIGVIVRSRVLQTPTNIFMASLAVGEIFIGVFAIPFAAASAITGRWPFTDLTCLATACLRTIGRSSSTYSLMAVCIDRCVAISRPLKYSHILTVKTSFSILICIWFVGFIMGMLPLWSWGSYQYDPAYYMCILIKSPDGNQHLTKEIICSFVPAAVIILTILQIIKEVKSHHRIFSVIPLPVTSSSNANGDILPGIVPGARGFNRSTARAMRSLFVVTCGYALFCLPASVTNITYQDGGWPSTTPRHVITTIVWLSFLCCVINPAIIIMFNRKFRAQLKSMFHPRPCKSFTGSKEIFTISSGLHTILDATLVLNMVKNEHASTTASTRRQILGLAVVIQ